MLTRRTRNVLWTVTLTFMLFVFGSFLFALGLLGENVAVGWLQDAVTQHPVLKAIWGEALGNPSYALVVFLLSAVGVTLVVDAFVSRSSVDLALLDPVIKPLNPKNGVFTLEGLFLFFENVSRNVGISAEDVTATVTLWSSALPKGKVVAHGMWIVTKAVPHVTAVEDPVRTWTFKPNDQPGKLALLLLEAGNPAAMLRCEENYIPALGTVPAGWYRHSGYIAPPGEYLVLVRLRGLNTKGRYWCRVISDGTHFKAEALDWWAAPYRWAFILARLSR